MHTLFIVLIFFAMILLPCLVASGIPMKDR